MTVASKYEPVIGLEVHAQLKTHSKLFCHCSTKFGQLHNNNVCPVCMGLPGVLPVLNSEAVNMAIKVGLSLNCHINEYSKFDRKQYFYPDLPKNYQISQYDQPIAQGGYLVVNGKKIRIHRVHMEEDAGKLVHVGSSGISGASYSLVDYNRTGTPLVEIVSEPDIQSAEDAKVYMTELRNILRYIDVCDGNLEEGSMRCDANVSIKLAGSDTLGTRAEVKNVNSFKALERAIKYEIERQVSLLEHGERIIAETRLWKEETGKTISMRSKEEANDYRYFPEPDLMPLVVSSEWLAKVKSEIPELPAQKRERYVQELHLSDYDAEVIVESMELTAFFDKITELNGNIKGAVNWLMGDITYYLKEHKLNLSDTKLMPESLKIMVDLIDQDTISSKIAKTVVVELLEKGGDPRQVIEQLGMNIISDATELEHMINRILEIHADQVEKYKSGKKQIFGFFVGQAMKETQGRANPQLINKLLKEKLD